MSLFRKAYIEARDADKYGGVILARPLSASIILTSAFVFFLIGLTFCILFEYSRKERVTGIIAPEKGVIQIASPVAGQVAAINTAEGEQVKLEQPLIIIRALRSTTDGNSYDLQKKLIDTKRRLLKTDMETTEDITAVRNRRITEMSNSLKTQKSVLSKNLMLQQQRYEEMQKGLFAFEELSAKGFVSQVQLIEKRQQILEQASKINETEVGLINLDRQQLENSSDIELARGELSNNISKIRQQLESLSADEVNLQSASVTVIHAPTSGISTGLIVRPGQYVREGQSLFTILPGNGNLIGNLFIPSSNVGQLVNGQRVIIRFPAFPYAKFGSYSGTIKSISRTAIPSTDVKNDIGRGGIADSTGYFRAEVVLDKQVVIDDRGKSFQLLSGLEFEAHIIVESKSLLSWAFSPLLNYFK